MIIFSTSAVIGALCQLRFDRPEGRRFERTGVFEQDHVPAEVGLDRRFGICPSTAWSAPLRTEERSCLRRSSRGRRRFPWNPGPSIRLASSSNLAPFFRLSMIVFA